MQRRRTHPRQQRLVLQQAQWYGPSTETWRKRKTGKPYKITTVPGPCGSTAAAAHTDLCDGFGAENYFSFLIVSCKNQLLFLIFQCTYTSQVFFRRRSSVPLNSYPGSSLIVAYNAFNSFLSQATKIKQRQRLNDRYSNIWHWAWLLKAFL